ncbi:MAG TPA: CRTAC1 family protein [Casimicrobiaceae bacterium]|nr:CRTAC1 family protein [Casimicrobiaceae bacterium]
MTGKRAVGGGLILVAAAAIAFVLAKELSWTDAYWLWHSRGSFVEYPIPFKATQLLMDIGVVDANGDDWLDIFTTNHNYRQDLLISDGKGGYRDMLSDWGLDQVPAIPGVEISLREPDVSAPGLYIYWKGRKTLTFRTYRLKDVGRVRGKLRTYTSINSYKASGFAVEAPTTSPAAANEAGETVMGFASEADGTLDLEIETPGVPVEVQLDGSLPLSSVYVGSGKASPRSANFDLTFQDRHGMAWADYDDSGRMGIFISRGALAGTARTLPPKIGATIEDELFVSTAPGKYKNVASDVGIDKRGCSGRKVNWVDFDRDGRLDIFVNCQDRGRVVGAYPKQLYKQGADKHFVDVASDVGLALADQEIIDFVWFDADNDGFSDLLAYEDTGFYLYRNHEGKSFTREFIGRGKFVRGSNPKLRGTADEYWFVDGKLSVADFRGSGSLDVFCSSKTGNVLLVNDGHGHFSLVDPQAIGLPSASATAGWVDFDNDGLIDLYAVPQGIYRQRPDHRFESTGLLAFPPQKYMAAIVTWADLDNDGRRDAVIALIENFALWRWWEKLYKSSEDKLAGPEDKFVWNLTAYRNTVANRNHWLELRLVGKPGNAQAIGARVTLQTPDGQQTQVVGLNDGAFFSQGHYRLYFGLGARARADRVTVRWPDGQVQDLGGLDGDRLQIVRQDGAPRTQ